MCLGSGRRGYIEVLVGSLLQPSVLHLSSFWTEVGRKRGGVMEDDDDKVIFLCRLRVMVEVEAESAVWV